MDNKFIYLGMFLLIIITAYHVNQLACSYCFQSYMAQEYVFKDKEINFDSDYINNTENIEKHRTSNIIGKGIGVILWNRYLNLLFWISASALTAFIFFRKLFNYKTALFASLIFITNPTINVTAYSSVYYFISLLFLYLLLETKKIFYLLLFLLGLIAAFNADITPAFIIIITAFSIVLFYSLFKKEKRYLLFFSAVIAALIIFERLLLYDLIHRLPLFFTKLNFYIASYPRGLYFYLYILRILVLVIPLLFLMKDINVKRNIFRYSYLLTMIPLFFLFTLFDISARIFDYYMPLIGAISYKRLVKNKFIFISTILFLILFSLVSYYIPPRSLERYDPQFMEGLSAIPEDAIVYADLFVASALINEFNHVNVIGPNFNRNKDEFNEVYYKKDKKYIKRLFFDNNVNFFIISRQSLERGLDVLNAPHFLKPIKDIEEYNNLDFLKVYYNNEDLHVWEIVN